MNNLSERSIKILASMGLILTTMIWGFAFVVMKNSVDVIPPTYLLAVRFSMSAVLLALLFHKNMMKADRETVLCGVILGAFLCLSYQFQTYGLSTRQQARMLLSQRCMSSSFRSSTGSSVKRDLQVGISPPRFSRSSVLRFCHCREISRSITEIF